MQIVLFDDQRIRRQLLPLTYTRPVGALRVGILTIFEKWSLYLGGDISWKTESYLNDKYTPFYQNDEVVFVNGALLPDAKIAERIKKLNYGEGYKKGQTILAIRASSIDEVTTCYDYNDSVRMIEQSWDIFRWNPSEIEADFNLITRGRVSEELTDPFTHVYTPNKVFIEKGAVVKAAILNAEAGPIYIGKNARINEGAIIRGPFAVCEHGAINMASKIREGTTVGPWCTVGGEIKNVVFQGYSNKGHDGYLGNSVIGEWCNLGANTNASNMKNTYSLIRMWSESESDWVETGLQHCGLIMGDHVKTAISTMFTTGTVIGVNAQIAMSGFVPKVIPSFSWITDAEQGEYTLSRALDVAESMFRSKKVEFTLVERQLLTSVYQLISK